MKKKSRKKSTIILLSALIIMVLTFVAVTFSIAKSTYERNVAEEKITEPDFYSMAEFSAKNSDSVMKALKAGDAEKLKTLMINSEGVEELLDFADWAEADLENVTSMGAGSLSAAPDKKGQMDISERFFVNVGDQKYVLYIETLTSRHGMINEGVSLVGATTYEHFDELDYNWNGDSDDSSAAAGKSFLKK